MEISKTLSKLSFFGAGIGLAAVVFYLFTYSTYEEKENVSHQRMFNQNYQIYTLNLPSEIDFAGEQVPTQLIDVGEKLDRELLVNTYWQSNGFLLMKRANRWFPVIEPILKKNNVPDDFKYLALIESGLTPIVSPAGATGFWQIMKSTGKEYGLTINDQIDERYHVEKSTEAACQYLLEAKEKFGSWTSAASSYNMGMNGMQRQMEKQRVSSYYDLLLNEETSRYVFRIIALKYILANPQQFGFNYRMKDLYPSIPTEEIQLDSSVTNFAYYAKEIGINYKVLKYFNPWLRKPYLKNSSNKTYTLLIPTEEYRNKLMLETPNFKPDTTNSDSL
ncbi:MAG: murein transglycosylase [Crocinitomicaceae bacterium]|nr:murein transglycosylase [Crocinitomicaceae bacterium]|tara:strand:- start:8685 stop:9683 length:999 start_codon:yes stop_codon:yes gene_type:complete